MFKIFVSKLLVIITNEQITFFHSFARDIALHEFRNLMKYIYQSSFETECLFKNALNKTTEIESIQEWQFLRTL